MALQAGRNGIKLRPQLRKALVFVVARGGINSKANRDLPHGTLAELETLGLVHLIPGRKGAVWHPTQEGRDVAAVESPEPSEWMKQRAGREAQRRRGDLAVGRRAHPTVSCNGRALDIIAYWRTVGVSGFVYFIQQGDDGPVKIGHAADPVARVRLLQVGNPAELHLREVVLSDASTERTLHEHWRQARIRGEWFGRGHEAEILETAGRIADYQHEARVVERAEFPEITGKVLVKALFTRPETSEEAA